MLDDLCTLIYIPSWQLIGDYEVTSPCGYWLGLGPVHGVEPNLWIDSDFSDIALTCTDCQMTNRPKNFKAAFPRLFHVYMKLER